MKNKFNNILDELADLLDGDYGRFSNYQQLPPCVNEIVGKYISDIYTQTQVSLDSARYDWLIKQIKPKNMSIVEIGSNLGYFVLRLSSEFDAKVEAYEPVSAYAKATSLMAKLCNVEKNVNCIESGVFKDDLIKISKSDLIIHLNVLHHAGIEYDHKSLKKIGSWENYALEYLSLLGKNGKKLFLQTGNISSEKRLFPMEESVPYIYSLLKKSGWNVKAIGLIENFDQIKYCTYASDKLESIPITKCIRNSDTGLVDYFRNGKLCISLPTGLAARPLWYCERRE